MMKDSFPQEIIIIVADSLRFDSVYSPKKNDVLGMPYIEKHSNQYLNVRSNGCWTLPSTTSIFTGLHLHEHGATAQSRKLGKGVFTLAEILKEKDYDTVQITANSATTEIFGLNKGFNKLIKIWEHVPQKINPLLQLVLLTGKPRFRKYLYSKDETMNTFAKEYKAGIAWFQNTYKDILSKANEILEKNRNKNKKTFLFINIMETHFPYHISSNFQLSEDKILSNIRELKGLYHLVNQSFLKKEKNYFSSDTIDIIKKRQKQSWLNIRRSVDQFVEKNHINNNLIFLCSDHGDNFGEQNWYYHFSNLTEGGIRVPLFVIDEYSDGHQEEEDINLNYIFYKVISKLGISNPNKNTQNVSSIPIMESYWYNKQGLTLSRYKYNQFCFVHKGNKCVLRNDNWYISPTMDYFINEQEYPFRELDLGIDPIEEFGLCIKDKKYLLENLAGFKNFSSRLQKLN